MMATNNTSQTQRIVQNQINFLTSSIDDVTGFVHRWRRTHIANLLTNYNEDLQFKQSLLVQLSTQETKEGEAKEALTKQLNEERAKVAESEEKFKNELDSCEEQINELNARNKKLSKMLKQMIQFVKSQKHAFFGYLAERAGDNPMTWAAYQEILDNLDDDTLEDRLATLALEDRK
ncbi:unnamed protein product [Adineta steineri]|uniref:Uncharacterized protein n=1 Tax=Adineta steineri TaxID=433720 RepID=A0A814TIE5_9BILA|nr:unnamed protein product [Adineta steineri]CAF1597718.1 unnamed protein product [Adineta steineri]